MKRQNWIACLLCTVFIGSSLLGVGCKKEEVNATTPPVPPTALSVNGTEGAKILLARQRLDETVFEQKLDFWGTQTAEATPANAGVKAMTATQEYSGFEPYSSSMNTFNNTFREVEERAERVAGTIADIKINVGETEKWVGQHLLQVRENEEVLIEKGGAWDANGVQTSVSNTVARRITDSNAKNTYEIYNGWQSGGESGQIRLHYEPNARYESMYLHSSGFSDYMVAEKSTGYWTFMRFGYSGTEYPEWKDRAIFNYYFLKDGIGHGVMLDFTRNEALPFASYTLIDTETGVDLYDFKENGDGTYSVSTYINNIASGLRMEKNENEQWELFFADGSSVTSRTSDGDVRYSWAIKEKLFEVEQGEISFNVTADSLADAFSKMDGYWSQKGVRVRKTASSLHEAAEYTMLLGENLADTYEWNGYKINGFDNFDKSFAGLSAFYAQSETEIKEAEKFPKWVEPTPLPQKELVYDFAETKGAFNGGVRYADGKITVTDASLIAKDTPLFEEDGEYTVKLALALREADGSLSPVNAVTLANATESKVKYTQEQLTEIPKTETEEGYTAFTVSAVGEYTLPAEVEEGKYAVVAYLATANEGIRVSEFTVVPFTEASAGGLEDSPMRVTVAQTETGLSVQYAIKLAHWIEAEAGVEYTAESLERRLVQEALICGYPKLDESLKREDGEAIDVTAPLSAGVYKLKCYLMQDGELEEAYIYCELR